MNIEINAENAYARKVLVTVPAGDVRAELDKAFSSVGGSARLRGFRKGKVPRKVLEARFGPQIKVDVANALIQRAYQAALIDHKLQVVSQPQLVEQGEVAPGSDFTFTIALEVKPEVEAQTYTGLSVHYPQFEVSDDEVEAAIERRRQAQARLSEVEGRAVEEGDSVQVELKVVDGDDTVVDEPGTLIRTSGDIWFAGIESALVGMNVGDEKTETIAFAESARNEAVAGKELSASFKVLSIQSLVVPELDDELAKDLGFEGGVEELTAKTRDELAKGREDAARNQARANLLQALIEANEFEVPAGMVEQNLNLLMEELKIQQAYMGRDPRTISFSDAQIADLRQRAAFAAKGGLLLEFVSAKENIEVTEADLEAKYAELAAMRDQSVEAIKGFFVKDEAVEDLRQRILEEKTLDWLLENAEISHEAPAAEAAGEE